MAIRKWHVGKVVLLWLWGLALCALIVSLLKETATFIIGFPLIGLLFAILVSLSVVTWKWLSGKEQ
jgi:hypothetical protein